MSLALVLTGIVLRLIALYQAANMLRHKKDWRFFILSAIILASLVNMFYWNGLTIQKYIGFPLTVSITSFLYGVVFVVATNINKHYIAALEENRRTLSDHVNLFEQFAYSAPLACFIFQQERIVFSNQAASILTGYSASELRAMAPHTIAHKNSKDYLINLESTDEDITSFEISMELTTKSGEQRWGLATLGSAVYNGKPATVGTILDVTQHKNDEQEILEAEKRIRIATNASNTVIWDVDLITEKSKFVVPETLTEEYDFAEGQGKEELNQYVYEPDKELLEKTINQCIQNNAGFEIEYRRYNNAGEVKWWTLDGKAQRSPDGTPVRLSGTSRCIHDQKLAEETLKENEARFRLATEIAGIQVWEWAINSNEVRHDNEQTTSACGQVTGFDDFIRRVHPDHKKRIKESIEQVLTQGVRYEEEFPLLSNQGEYRWQLSVGQLLYDDQGAPQQMIGAAIDTTDRHSKDELIRFQADLLNRIGQSVVAQNKNGELTYLNKAAEEAFGIAYQESAAIDISSLMPTEKRIQGKKEIIDTLKAGKQWAGEITAHTLYGTNFPIFLSASPLYDEKGEYDGFVGISTDLSAYKEIQEALHESEERLRLAIDAANLVVWDLNLDTGKVVHTIPSSIKDGAAERFNSLQSIQESFHPDDQERTSFQLKQCIEKQKPFDMEHRFMNEDNSFDWWQSRAKLYDDNAGNPRRMIGTSQMITLRKEAEIQLQHRIHQLQAIYNIADASNRGENLNAIFLTAVDGAKNALHADRVAILTFDETEELKFAFADGLSQPLCDAILEHCPWQSKESSSAPIFAPNVENSTEFPDLKSPMLDAGIQSFAKFPLKYKDHILGKFVLYFDTPRTLSTSDQQLAIRIANHISLSIEKTKSEKALVTSQANNKAIFDALPDMFFHVNKEGVFTDFKATHGHPLILPRENIIGSNILDMPDPDLAEKASKMLQKTVRTQTLQVLEYTLEIENETRFFEARFAPAGAENVLIVIRDITDRNRAQKALTARTLELQTIADTIPDSIFRIGKDLKMKFANKAVLEAANLTLEEFAGLDASAFGCPDSLHKKWTDTILEVIEKKKMVELNFDMEDPVLGTQHFHALLAPESTQNQQKVGSALAVLRNITEERRLQQTIIDISARQQRSIGQDLHDELGQLLTGIGFKIAGLQHDLDKIDQATADQNREISQLVEKAISQTRMLAEGLNPVTLEVHGLRAGLEKLAFNTENTFGVDCPFTCEDNFKVENEEIAVQLYRIGQEAINNAIKHGKPSRIAISLVQENGKAELLIKDDGTGFKISPKDSDGHGLRIMDYRARVIGAAFQIDSRPQKGTTVRCQFKNTKKILSQSA
ncbi:MAG: PAS domain S-box protein [Rhodothermales bacterium]